MNASTRLILIAAGGCAAVGFALKVADLTSRKTSTTPARVTERAGSSRTASRPGEPVDIGREGSRTDVASATDEANTVAPGGDGTSAPRPASHGRSQTPYELLESGRVHTLSPRQAARIARREAREAQKRGGSLAVAEAGGSGPTGLPGAGSTASDSHAGGGGAAGTAAANATPPATPEPPATSFPYSSGDQNNYALNEQVAVDDIGKIAPRSGTMSFWLQPGWQTGNQDDANFLEVGDGQLQVIKNVNFLRFEFTDATGAKGGIGAPITDWQEGQWHQVTTTWTGNTYSLYIDGQLVSQTQYPGGAVQVPPDAKLLIGSAYPENRPVAPGTINGVDVSGRPLSPAEIAAMYARATGTQNPTQTSPTRKN
ncbi:MAG TPA: LamG domain-containing protein [Candidatus Binatia bacterium]|nr:LamG domain-containing protein [Candidatus Binatia bacterium]